MVADPYLDKTTYTKLPPNIEKIVEKIDYIQGLKKADTVIISTAHKEFRNIKPKDLAKNLKKGAKIIDLWNIYEKGLEKEKINYVGLGRGDLK